MAGSQKEALLSTHPKSIRDSNGKDFHVSWNSTAQEKNKPPFTTGTDHEKMKFFDFGKLDDFEFDAEFGNVSSFKLDMPELDFSSPKRRPTKSKEGSEGEAIGGKPEKKSGFSFSFDFNELNSFDIDSKMTKGETKLNRKNQNEDSETVEGEIDDFSKVEATKKDERDSSSFLLKPRTNDQGRNLEHQREVQLEIGSKTPTDGNLTRETYMQSSNFLQTATSDSSSPAKLESASGGEQANNIIRLEESTQSKTNSLAKARDLKRLLAFSSGKQPRTESVPLENLGNIDFVSNELPQMQAAIGENSLSPVSDKFLRVATRKAENPNPVSKLQLTLQRENSKSTKDNGSIDILSLARNKLEIAGSKSSMLIGPNNLRGISNRKMETTSVSHRNWNSHHTGDGAQSGGLTGGFNKSFDLGLKTESSTAKSQKNDDDDKSTLSLAPSIQKPVSTSGLADVTNAALTNENRGNFVKSYDRRNLSIARPTKSPLSTSNVASIETEPEVHSEAATLKAPSLGFLCGSLEKRARLSPSLKRKSVEVEDPGTSNSPKRGHQSPNETRKFLQISPTILHGPTGTLKEFTGDAIFEDLNHFVDLEVPTVEENDGIIEKAEACAKELDNICSMLRKKHEEAKELLVRAIVTNNSLLMLDHPLYEEKIHSLQRLAASALSRNYGG